MQSLVGTPFEACVEGASVAVSGQASCKSGYTTTDNGHIQVELSAKDIVPVNFTVPQ